MASQAEYNNNGNTLSKVTDALGKTTLYGYDAETGVLDWVQYPEDSATERTSYDYDDMYRAEVVTSQLSSETALTVTYGYTDDLLTSVNTGSTEYGFEYGLFDLRSAVKIGSRELASYSYTDDQYFNLKKLEYGNSDSVSYTYDSLGRVTLETYEDGDTVSYSYDNNGALATVTDSATGCTTTYYYDSTDRLMKVVESGAGYSHAVGYAYDNINNLTGLVETINGVSRTTGYTYDEDNRIVGMTVESGARTYTYDSLGRLSQRVSGLSDGSVLTETFTYTAPSAAAASGQVATMRLQGAGLDVTYSYTYDDNGNILTVSDGTHTTHYTYDKANQLVREDNQGGGFTHVWSYDTAGNILSRTEYGYTTGSVDSLTPTDTVNYIYGDTDWGDLLTAYDGVNISYDGIGNPLSDGTWSYTWEHGRELASMTDGTATWNYTYDVNGLRTSRTNGTTTYSYVYNGSSLSKLTVGDTTLYFTYGAEGHPLTLTHNGTTYFYATNLQGDVVAILNSSGNPVVRYTYDAWGNILTVTDTSNISLATLNPLRYRGYVFDQETGLYYLQSRYYDPSLGRFLNADAYTSTGQGQLGNNMFAYCNNSPISYKDSCGMRAEFTTFIKYSGPTRGEFVIPNDKYNKVDGMIYGQGDFEFSDDPMHFGTYRENGCGIIAVYNALQLLGCPEALGKIESDLVNMGGTILWGHWGLNPLAINTYLSLNEISHTTYFTSSSMTESLYEGAIFIVFCMNDKDNIAQGFHFVAGQYVNGRCEVYNRYNTQTTVQYVPDLDSIAENGHLFWGVIIGG